MRRHIMVCISGWAGTGKDECAGVLVNKFQAIQTGLADPAKRHMADVYGFSEDQLFGPSKFRNAGDSKYPKPIVAELGLTKDIINEACHQIVVTPDSVENMLRFAGSYKPLLTDLTELASKVLNDGQNGLYLVRSDDPRFFLSPREALQRYCELLNMMYADTWIKKGIEVQRQLATGQYSYSRMLGLVPSSMTQWNTVKDREMLITCFADFRHIHEHKIAKLSADETLTPVLIRVKRPSVSVPPYQHRSETEQLQIRDSAYDFIVDNSKDLQSLHERIVEIVEEVSDPAWRPREWDEGSILRPEEVQRTYVP